MNSSESRVASIKTEKESQGPRIREVELARRGDFDRAFKSSAKG